MPRTSYRAVFIREIEELLTIAYLFELLFDNETDSEWNDLIPLELVEFCEQIYPMIQETRYLAPRDRLSRSHHSLASQIHCMSDDRFISFFRMSRSTFNDLVGMIEDDPVFENNSQIPQLHPSVQIAAALYQLGLQGSSTVRSAEQLGLGEGTLRLYLWRVFRALLNIEHRCLSWPRGDDYRRMRAEIKEWSGFPGCIGFLDGSDINLRFAPEWYAETYFHRKKHYGFNVQAVCDVSRRFTFVGVGFPASVGDPAAFAATSLSKTPHQFFNAPEEYLLGDEIYQLTRRCVTPYKEPQASQRQDGYKNFNYRHAHARVKVEHAFGVLKERWQSLKAIPMRIRSGHDHGKALCWMMACFILHNFIQIREEDRPWLEIVEAQAEQSLNAEEDNDRLSDGQELDAGKLWRDELRIRLYQNGELI